MRKFVLILIVAGGLGGFVTFKATRHPNHDLHFKTYFRQGSGLQTGAQVRVDGVDVGSVTSVRVRPELGERPIEVLMRISTSYQLSIPNDSSVLLAADGVLGPTIVDIDTRKSHGPPAADNGVLNSLELTDLQNIHAIERFADAAGQALIQASRRGMPSNSAKSTPGK